MHRRHLCVLGALTALSLPSNPAHAAGAKGELAVSAILDTSGSMSGPRMDEAKRAMQLFFGTLGSKVQAGLVTFNGCSAPETLPLRTHGGAVAADSTRLIGGLEAHSGSTPIVNAYRAAHRQLQSAGGAQRGILLVTDGMGNCSNEQQFCSLASRYKAQGINTVVVGYLLDASAEATFSCGDVNVYYGISASTPPEQYGRRLIRALFRARREFLSHLDPKYQKSLWAEVEDPFCMGEKLGQGWTLMGMSEVRHLGKKKTLWIPQDTPLDDLDFHPIQPAGHLPPHGRVEVGAEDLIRVRGDRKEYYVDLFEDAHRSCESGGSEAPRGRNPAEDLMPQLLPGKRERDAGDAKRMEDEMEAFEKNF